MKRLFIALTACVLVCGRGLPEATSADEPNTAADSAKLAAAKEKYKADWLAFNRLTKSRDEELSALKRANRELEEHENAPVTDATLDAAESTSPTDKKRLTATKELVRLRRDEWNRQAVLVQTRWGSILDERRLRLEAAAAELDALEPNATLAVLKAIVAERHKQNEEEVKKAELMKRGAGDVRLALKGATQHQYLIGQGEGAGYGGVSSHTKVRFLRLEYSGGNWAQDMELNSDLNLLTQFGAQTGQKVTEKPETSTIRRLGGFKIGFGPPLVYLTGDKSIVLNKQDVQDLRKYLLDNCGMLFIDNGGGKEFHDQAFIMMKQVAPEIEPVRVPLDDVIHTVPNELKFLPLVTPHGGRDSWGWRHKGRWIAYYHPGDIGNAWADGHAGVKSDIREACYGLGVNAMLYALTENAKWRAERKFE